MIISLPKSIHMQKPVSFVMINLFLPPKKMCFFIKSVSIFCSPSILEQHQWFEPAWHTKSSWSQRRECHLNCLHSSIPVGLLVGEGWQKNETGSCFKLVLDVASKLFLICLPQKYSSHYSTVQHSSKYSLFLPVWMCACACRHLNTTAVEQKQQ